MEISNEQTLSKQFYEDESYKTIDFIFTNNQKRDLEISFSESYIPNLINESLHYLCPQCSNFPLIEFIDENKILYKCYCFNQILVDIKDLFRELNYNKELNDNKLLNPILYDTMDSELNKYNSSYNEEINKFFGFKCVKHKSKICKFKYYCNKCQKNLCKMCCSEHLEHSQDLTLFDFKDINLLNKINNLINPMIIQINKKITSINENTFIDENNIKYNETSVYKIKILENNKINKILKNNYRNYQFFIELINIIIFDYKKYPNIIHFLNIDNIFRFFIKRIKSSLCYILGDNPGAGFFCYIPINNQEEEEKNITTLILNNYIFPEKNIYFGNKIKIKVSKNKIYDLSFDSNRKIYIDKSNGIIIIEIRENDNIKEINYLEIEERYDIIKLKDKDKYKKLFLLNPEKEIKYDLNCGDIININENDNEFEHNINSNEESIGGPLLTKDYKVLGINKGKNNINNLASFIMPSIIKYQNILRTDVKSLYIDVNSVVKSKVHYKDKYIILNLIGYSIYSEVYKVKLKNTNEYRAIKIINKEKTQKILNINNEELSKEILNEINNIKKINTQDSNDNSIKYYEYFDIDNEFAIVIELCDDNLLNLLESKKKFEIYEIYDIIQQINNFFKTLFDYRIIHGNLKLENILINYIGDKNHIKIKMTDYGKSKKIINIKSKFDISQYIAPEIIDNKDKFDKIDLWSLGIIIYKLSFGNYPYNAKNSVNLLNIIKSCGQKNFEKTNDFSLDDLISKLLKSKSKRLSWEDYFNHPFCNENLFKLNEKRYAKKNVLNGKEKEINFYYLKLESEFLVNFKDIKFENLEILNLSKNYIKLIDNLQNFLCPNLKNLDFSINYIENIDNIHCWKFKKLKLLNFSHNKIKEISVFNNNSLFKNFKLKIILLSNNSFDNNDNKQAIKVIKSQKIIIDIDI